MNWSVLDMFSLKYHTLPHEHVQTLSANQKHLWLLGDGNVNLSDLIFTYSLYILNDHTVAHKHEQLK